MTHGNITNVPYGSEDTKRFFAIYGAQVPGLRGKTTAHHVKRARTMDLDSKVQITSQEMTADVMYVAGDKFLVSISKPLGLLLVKPLSSLAVQEVGSVLQQHINTLRSRGFRAQGNLRRSPHEPCRFARDRPRGGNRPCRGRRPPRRD